VGDAALMQLQVSLLYVTGNPGAIGVGARLGASLYDGSEVLVEGDAVALLAQQLSPQSFNLLQGEFAPKRPQSKLWQQWRLSASLALATLLVYLVTVGMQGYKAGSQAQADIQAANQMYKQRFPQERVVNLRRQVERKLAASGGSDSSMVGLLAQIQPSLSSMPSMTLDNLRYDVKKSELRFQATAADFAAFEQLKGKLQQQGLQVEQGALSQIEGKVQGTLAIRGKA